MWAPRRSRQRSSSATPTTNECPPRFWHLSRIYVVLSEHRPIGSVDGARHLIDRDTLPTIPLLGIIVGVCDARMAQNLGRNTNNPGRRSGQLHPHISAGAY